MTDASNDNSYVDAYQPPVSMAQSAVPAPSTTSSDSPAATAPAAVTQALEDQNIFFLLGVDDGTDDEKEEFLDELQAVIWESFVEDDVKLLLTEEEMVEFQKIQAKKDVPEEQIQEEMVIYLEKLIPDLEEIMLEKALELKADMFNERIQGMKEYYAGDAAKLNVVNQAATLVDDNQWRDAAVLLNGLAA